MDDAYSVGWLKQQAEMSGLPKFLYFWGHRSHASGQVTKACFSQWWPCRFAHDGETYVSAEHWMMAEKARLFGADDIRTKILATDKPGAAKALGRQIVNFDQTVWDAEKYEIVAQGNVHKFGQNPDLKAFLLGTAPRVLVEASPVDSIWGIGLEQKDPKAAHPETWQGENLLGFALMTARDRLASA